MCRRIENGPPDGRARLLMTRWQPMENAMFRVLAIALVCGMWASAAGAQDAARGEKVYMEQKCSVCHSVAGAGNKKGPLDDVGSKLSATEIRQWITAAPDMAAKAKADRKPVMKAYTTLAKDDLDSLVAYLQTLKK
jgi:mono/diheme cytochrome c family protein